MGPRGSHLDTTDPLRHNGPRRESAVPFETDKPQYVEFDDEFIFVNSSHETHIFSRTSRLKLAVFPPEIDPAPYRPHHYGCLGFEVDEDEMRGTRAVEAGVELQYEEDLDLCIRTPIYPPSKLDPVNRLTVVRYPPVTIQRRAEDFDPYEPFTSLGFSGSLPPVDAPSLVA